MAGDPVGVRPGVPVEDLQEACTRDLNDVPVVEGPGVVGMVDGCYSPGPADGVDVSLERRYHIPCIDRFHHPGDPNPVQMNGGLAVADPYRELFTRNHEGSAEPALLGSIVQQGQMVMVGEHQKVIPVSTVPPDYRLGVAVPIGLVGVGVDVALEPHWLVMTPPGRYVPDRLDPAVANGNILVPAVDHDVLLAADEQEFVT